MDRNKLILVIGGLLIAGSLLGQSGSTGRSSVSAIQSGTWTVQPGNTANTTAWKVDGSAVTQPVSGTVTTTPPSNASTNIAQVGGTAVVADPCAANAKVFFSFSGTASATLVTGTSAKKIYICSWQDQSAGAQNMAVVEGTGTVCATGIAAMSGLSGGTTAATGWNNAANGGRAYGDGGHSIAGEGTNADNLCVLLSAAVQTNIGISYVVQ